MPRHPVPKTKLLSTTCRRCQLFKNKTQAKKACVTSHPDTFGWCDYCGPLTDRPVPAGPVPCLNYRYKPCSVGNTYAVINLKTLALLYVTPIQAEAKQLASRQNNPDVIAIEITKIK